MTGAIAEARAVIAAGSKSFALASRLLPASARDRAAVVYAWCRRADDSIDLAPPEERPHSLARLEGELDVIYGGGAVFGAPVLRAFAAVVRERRIPRLYPAELVAGMAMDASGHRYVTLDDLFHYCFRVAGTVGLMMCHVLGLSDESALENAAHLGIAMQLTNICRDVHEDWRLGRLYVPLTILRDCGLGALPAALGGPFPAAAREPLKRAVARLLDEADRHYESGRRGLRALPWRAALAVRAAALIYAAIGGRVRAQGCDVLARRAVVPAHQKAFLVARALGAALGDIPLRLGRAPAARIPAAALCFPRAVTKVAGDIHAD